MQKKEYIHCAPGSFTLPENEAAMAICSEWQLRDEKRGVEDGTF